MNRITHICGVDEVGRGPLAGPVAVGVVVVPAHFDWRSIPKVNDSKLLKEEVREEIFWCAKELQERGKLKYTVSMVSAPVIDRVGITRAVDLAMQRALSRIGPDENKTFVKLDGLLRAPEQFVYQETIVKGDQKEKVIGLASIVAKVTRDRYMVKQAKKYPEYAFESHKGYGTQNHLRHIVTCGPCILHRRTYLKGRRFA